MTPQDKQTAKFGLNHKTLEEDVLKLRKWFRNTHSEFWMAGTIARDAAVNLYKKTPKLLRLGIGTGLAAVFALGVTSRLLGQVKQPGIREAYQQMDRHGQTGYQSQFLRDKLTDFGSPVRFTGRTSAKLVSRWFSDFKGFPRAIRVKLGLAESTSARASFGLDASTYMRGRSMKSFMKEKGRQAANRETSRTLSRPRYARTLGLHYHQTSTSAAANISKVLFQDGADAGGQIVKSREARRALRGVALASTDSLPVAKLAKAEQAKQIGLQQLALSRSRLYGQGHKIRNTDYARINYLATTIG